MAELFKRPGSDKWQAYCWYYDGTARQRVQRSTGILDNGPKSKLTAQIVADQIERGYAAGGETQRRPSKTLAQALRALTEAAELAGRSDHTLDNIMYRGARLSEFFTDSKPLSDIDQEQLRAFAVWSREARSAWTVHRELVVLGAAYEIVGMTRPEAPDLGEAVYEHKPQRVLELDEQRAFLLAIPHERKLNIMAYLQLGLRLSEPWKIVSVEWREQYLSVQGTKTRKNRRAPRVVPIPDELFEMMNARRDEWPVFPTWHRKCVDFVVRRAGKRAGICEDLSVNDLRGTYATHMARAGVPQLTLAGILGNSVKMLDEVYAQVNKAGDHLTEAAAKLPRLKTLPLTAAKAREA
jgi:integrase